MFCYSHVTISVTSQVNMTPLMNSTTATPLIDTSGNSSFPNTTGNWTPQVRFLAYDRTPVIISVSLVSVVAVISNLTLLLVILCRRELRATVFLWNVAGMCVCNLLFGTVTNALGDSRHFYQEWIHGVFLCKVFSVLNLTDKHIMSMIQITIVISLFLKVRLSLSPPSDMSSRIWTILPYILFSLPWLGEIALIPMVILGETDDVPYSTKRYSSMFCYHIMEKQYRQAGLILFNALFFILLILSVAVFLYYRFKKASYDRLLADDAMRQDETLRSMLIASLASSGLFCLLFAPFILLMLTLLFCQSFQCFPNFTTFDAVYVVGSFGYAVTPLPWFAYSDIKCVCAELVTKLKEKAGSSLTVCGGCCRRRLDSITVEWSQKQSDVLKHEK